VTACGASAACVGFGPARNTAATFDVFYWLQVTNYGVLYVLFDSAPSGSNYIDVWDLCLHAQRPNYFVANVFSDDPRREQAEKAVRCGPAFRSAHNFLLGYGPSFENDRGQIAICQTSFVVNDAHSSREKRDFYF
jgi:hypothetical protein